MNYMEKVAHMLGVELEEEFKVSDYKNTFKMTKDGIYKHLENSNTWSSADHVLICLLNGIYQIEKPILNKAEKEYLSYVIKPFRKEIRSIMKVEYDEEAYIQINFHNYCDTSFPFFKNDTMYKGMEADKEYSLEDLRL